MPQTKSTHAPSLGIRLEREQPNFTLPDTVTGYVYCNTRVVSPEAIVTIALVGRSKSKMVVRHGSWGRTYRGRFALINESEHTHKLFEGPLHNPVDGEEKQWPFAVTMPTHFDAIKTAPGTPQDESYISLTSEESAIHTLPPSFVLQNWGYGEGMECFVEYFLRAELATTNRGSTETKQATQLLAITTLYHGPRRRNASWRSSQHPCSLMRDEISTVSTEHNLMPISDTSGQSPRSNQSKMGFEIIVTTPEVLQLSQPDPMSLFLLAVPMSHFPLDNALLTSQPILLTEISVKLVASTGVKCQGRRKARQDNAETKSKPWRKEVDQDTVPIIIPWREHLDSTGESVPDTSANPTSHDTFQALDVGIRLGLRLSDEGMYESFSTHNIQHSHRLEWKITLTLARQSLSLSGAEPVELVAPSRDDMPIEYETLQNELMTERTESADSGALPPEYAHERPSPPTVYRQQAGAFGLSRLWEGV